MNDQEFVGSKHACKLQLSGNFEFGEFHNSELKQLSQVLIYTHHLQQGQAHKRAASALQAMKSYAFDGARLFRQLYANKKDELLERLVVSAGGMKAMLHNGRKMRFTLRKRIVLEYYDEEAMGDHTSARYTTSQMLETCW